MDVILSQFLVEIFFEKSRFHRFFQLIDEKLQAYAWISMQTHWANNTQKYLL